MIKIKTKQDTACCAKIYSVNNMPDIPAQLQGIFSGEYLENYMLCEGQNNFTLHIGAGQEIFEKIQIKEIFAKIAKQMKAYKISSYSIDISLILEIMGLNCMLDIAQGLVLGSYEGIKYPEKVTDFANVTLCGVTDSQLTKSEKLLQEAQYIIDGTIFAIDTVNTPGNLLRPADFAKKIISLLDNKAIEIQLYSEQELEKMQMNALLAVGASSEFKPCMLVIRYLQDKQSKDITALVGKGVTCDTGGYCLKPSESQLGIKGDMAGGACVAGAIYALAKNKVKANVVGVIPICENRISSGSLLVGDVITSYSKKTIEIRNTDAEGRLILADSISYAVKNEKVTQILDVATLTGAVVGMLGFTVGGVVCDSEEVYNHFKTAFDVSGERYQRINFYREHTKMIKSSIADIKNTGEKFCGTISAALFIREFCEGLPWIHLDIAGTAWVDSPIFEYQSAGATGAGVSTLYYFCNKKGE